MIFTLFSIICGALASLFLISPIRYYPVFLLMLAITLIIFIISFKFRRKLSKLYYPVYLLLFLVSYYLISLLVFKNANYYKITDIPPDKNKKAVVFYCEGEMEKYTPYYANHFFKDTPYFFKPFLAFKYKNLYSSTNSIKNSKLLKVASEVRTSLLNYKPYYFYVAYSGYDPDVSKVVAEAASEGCSEIIFINYSNDLGAPEYIKKELKASGLQLRNITLKFSIPITYTDSFTNAYVKLVKKLFLHDKTLVFLDSSTIASSKIKIALEKQAVESKNMMFFKNASQAVLGLKSSSLTSYIYIDLNESALSINSEKIIPVTFSKLKDIKFSGVRNWYEEDYLVEAAIEAFKKLEKR